MWRSKLSKTHNRFMSGERYAMLPREVLESIAYKRQPDYAKCVLVALAAQYRGVGNGGISLTWAQAQVLGILTEWKLRAGMKLLELAGLCEITLRGGNVAGGQKIAALYGLGWRAIDPSEQYETIPGAMLKAPNRWATWIPPDDWRAQCDAIRRSAQGKAKGNHTREEQAAPHGGSGNGDHPNTRQARRLGNIGTHGYAPSRDIGGDVEEKALRLVETQPHLSDFDIAKALRWKVDPHRVRALREWGRQDRRPGA